MLSLTLSLCLGGLLADAPRSATLIPAEEQGSLHARLEELNSSPAPSLAPPIILLAGAVVGVGLSVAMFYVAALTSLLVGGANVIPLLVVGVVALIAGAGVGITGGVLLSSALRERRARNLERRDLEQKLRPVEAPGTQPSVQAPAPALLLATF